MGLSIERGVPWVLRAAWASLPFALGPALADLLSEWDSASRTAASLLLWTGWAAVAVATCVAMPMCLAVVRVGAGVAVVAGALARTPGALLAILAAGAAARPEAALWFVNGPAYANERRYPLRVPGPLVFGPLWLASALVVVGPTVAVLLLASGNYLAGAPVTIVGAALAYFSGRSLLMLTRRWLVFVPAGLVLHDPLTLADPVLFERKVIESLRPAASGIDSLDLTQAALGLPLELVLTEKVPMVLAKGRRRSESGASARLLFSPTRPGRVLAEAAERRIIVG
ncbi:MAG TPA: hypothetical protein VMZ22_00320 [Acidimicrobiales bacterium]|nr:hypothetical protein [Acidimicrobiales bacterium]